MYKKSALGARRSVNIMMEEMERYQSSATSGRCDMMISHHSTIVEFG